MQVQKIPILSLFRDYINHINITISPCSVVRYREVILHFKNYLASTEDPPHYLHEISPAFLEKYKQSRVDKIANQTINYELKVLNIIFNFAIKMKYIKENPVKEVSNIRVMKKKLPRFLSKKEINQLLGECVPDLKDIILFLLNTGLRIGELRHLTWEDVNWEKRTIRITAKEDWSPKAKQEREIPLNKIAYRILNAMQDRQGYIFATKTDFAHSIYRRFKMICKEVGIKNIDLHTLRHTFASHLVMQGVDILTVSKLLGHSSVMMTEKYAHLAQEHLRQAVERLSF